MKLSNYVPDFTNSIVDFQKLYSVEDTELRKINEELLTVNNAYFVRLLNERTVPLWEETFNVSHPDWPLEERKREILKLLAGFSKLSTKSIERIVLQYTSYSCECVFNRAESNIEIRFTEIGVPMGIESLILYLNTLTPAHLNTVLIQSFRRHMDLITLTHQQLSNYTHEEIYSRREPL
ncbi:putative phage tail protein [Culicoidibacter larvae]|uniref:DUF2313 domain-containing protein n=1 Tax=Culicoidibacter larvae TaxID=2579976 RepID=A0A5R8Q7D8_9FIRM|nr:putative phage tail protein [Culicoidibacter larvae]TLG71365.1 DUF2313 domain-containing protein [Culicoidibacter larvae]